MWKLNKAELGKIFLRPAVYFMTAFLAIALIITSLVYAPQTRETNLTNFGTGTDTVAVAFSAFNNDASNLNSKINLDNKLTTTNQNMIDYASATSAYNTIKTYIETINTSITTTTGTTLLGTLSAYASNNSSENRTAYISALTDIRTQGYYLFVFCNSEISSDNIDFYISTIDLTNLKNYFRNFYLSIPNETALNSATEAELISYGENVRENYTPTEQLNYINTAPRIEVSAERIAEITDTYYTAIAYASGSETVLTNIYAEILTYFNEHTAEDTVESRLALNELITKYKNATNIACELIENSFDLEKAGTFANSALTNYIGFETFNTYKIQEDLTLNSYLLTNQIFDGDYLLNFNFGTTSGYTASAYDFTIFAMQILSIIITIFCLFFAVSIIAGDQQNGTMKMLATRPLTREKIISGKTLACVNFMFIFMLFSAIASFAVGYSMFGISTTTMLMVYNSTTVIAIAPYLALLIYLSSFVFNILFYIVIAVLLSVIFRSNIFAFFVTFIIYFFGLLFNAIFANASWFIYTPYAHLDIFKYFGNASTNGGFLSFNLAPDGNFALSILLMFFVILFIDALSKAIFKSRDIA